MGAWLRAGGAAFALLLACPAWTSAQNRGPPVKFTIYAAGSLRQAFDDLLQAFGTPDGLGARAVYGGSGLLRQRLASGEAADVFASADMAQPRLLSASRGGTPVVLFARNTLCVIARRSIGLTRSNMLQRLTDPAVRIAMSVPGADPSGDYAERMFDRADVFRPGARAILDDKAMKLGKLSGSKRGSDAPPSRESLFKDGRIDAVIGYCSGAAPLTAHVPDLVAIPVDDALAVTPEYGLVVLSSNVAAARFALFVMSEQGQAILAHAGLLPVRLPTKLKSPIL